MNTSLENILRRQRERMIELREDARDLAETVADEVWDKFEVEIEDVIGEEFIFDCAEMIKSSLSVTLALNYDEAFERHVLGFFEQQQQELKKLLPSQIVFDDAKLNLAGLRKGMKLRRHATEHISQAIDAAKPSLIGMLFLSSDPTSESWDREMRDNARRVRTKLLALRGSLVAMIIDETKSVIHTARLAYVDALDTLFSKLDSRQVETAEAVENL